jgi:transposase InsO family protein
MPWNEVDVQEQRMQFVMRAASGTERLAPLCREFGISRPTGYVWVRRYRQVRSLRGLCEHSRRPKHSPRETEAWKQERVVALRRETGWGAKKLHVVLRDEEGLLLPTRTIHRILQRNELLSPEAHGPAPERFARQEPNELWQMDSKGKYPLREGACHPLSIVDDHSRFVVGLHALAALKMELAYPCLVETFRSYGVPQALLMDHGTLWWATSNGWGLTWLSVRLIEQGIRLMYGRVRHPQTQEKVERFHRTLGGELRHRGVPQHIAEWQPALNEIRQVYNERRPHEALGMQRPAQHYQASARAYQEQPTPWEYPAGSDVRRVNANGAIAEAGRKYFVCEALAEQLVRVERFDGKLLVSYRHMYIREIDLQRGTTEAFVVLRQSNAAASAAVALRAPSADAAEPKAKERQTPKV